MSDIRELNFLPVKGSPITPESITKDLQQRLSLYQVFVKLYENHGSLLEEILKLENLSQSSLKINQSHYIQAVLDDDIVYVTTNLRDGKSESLRQSQYTWTIGRDRNSGIHINNKYISRRHAAIRYIKQGFYLVDFNSTNGTSINGEQIYQPTKLEDGDIVRIGNITFCFFVNHSCCVLPTVAVELLMQLVPKTGNDKTETLAYYKNNTKTRKLSDSECIQEESLVNEITRIQTFEEQLSQQWKSDILETFYRKQTPKDSI
ncbi:MAG: FHA domain-containing protein [Richelia sp. RM2_1_2]|nr:FHA domain-containing protein [Richelia sp. SM2_1_7]NJM19047.1 FHA domain-containing protein [Richelia sp. SM1_7_0]NJN08675.1 FHA domain-containing protein [Richelia sp. RM1_1_1]NJO30211.1 FHA domain-containing protein [Richelia sp. SL_2_1]NJO59938.1 FHA domain-containing protein [Richelia sp. RM2_1_2]